MFTHHICHLICSGATTAPQHRPKQAGPLPPPPSDDLEQFALDEGEAGQQGRPGKRGLGRFMDAKYFGC